MTRYAKLLTALAGLIVGALGRRYGVDSQVYTDVVAALTAFGVWAVPNDG